MRRYSRANQVATPKPVRGCISWSKPVTPHSLVVLPCTLLLLLLLLVLLLLRVILSSNQALLSPRNLYLLLPPYILQPRALLVLQNGMKSNQ
jgi:hypothetical protein